MKTHSVWIDGAIWAAIFTAFFVITQILSGTFPNPFHDLAGLLIMTVGEFCLLWLIFTGLVSISGRKKYIILLSVSGAILVLFIILIFTLHLY